MMKNLNDILNEKLTLYHHVDEKLTLNKQSKVYGDVSDEEKQKILNFNFRFSFNYNWKKLPIKIKVGNLKYRSTTIDRGLVMGNKYVTIFPSPISNDSLIDTKTFMVGTTNTPKGAIIDIKKIYTIDTSISSESYYNNYINANIDIIECQTWLEMINQITNDWMNYTLT